MPEFRKVAMSEIDPPDLPMRSKMDTEKLHQLADSMRARTLLQPIGLTMTSDRYMIVWGHRRFVAAELNNWTEIDAKVFYPGESAVEADMLAENLMREDVNDAQIGIWLHELEEKHSYSLEQMCKALNRGEDWIAERYKLVLGDREVLNALMADDITFTQARELNRIEDEAYRRYYLDQAAHHGLPTRQIAEARKRIALSPSLTTQQPAQPAAQDAQPVAPAPVMACFICGGHKDPWNIVTVFIHQHELAQIQKLLQAQTEEG